jgi:hypothetical protein
MTHVHITYYKDTGKYYSEGEVDLPDVPDEVAAHSEHARKRQLYFYEAARQVREMLDADSELSILLGRSRLAIMVKRSTLKRQGR